MRAKESQLITLIYSRNDTKKCITITFAQNCKRTQTQRFVREIFWKEKKADNGRRTALRREKNVKRKINHLIDKYSLVDCG